MIDKNISDFCTVVGEIAIRNKNLAYDLECWNRGEPRRRTNDDTFVGTYSREIKAIEDLQKSFIELLASIQQKQEPVEQVENNIPVDKLMRIFDPDSFKSNFSNWYLKYRGFGISHSQIVDLTLNDNSFLIGVQFIQDMVKDLIKNNEK